MSAENQTLERLLLLRRYQEYHGSYYIPFTDILECGLYDEYHSCCRTDFVVSQKWWQIQEKGSFKELSLFTLHRLAVFDIDLEVDDLRSWRNMFRIQW